MSDTRVDPGMAGALAALAKKPAGSVRRKKPAKLLPRTLAVLRRAMWAADVVERKSAFIARDFLGFADIVGLTPGGTPVAIQVTTLHNAESHRKKIKDCPGAHLWLKCGGDIELWLWEKRDGRWHWNVEVPCAPRDLNCWTILESRRG